MAMTKDELTAFEALRAACVEFVRKCGASEARSRRSYAEMKEALALAALAPTTTNNLDQVVLRTAQRALITKLLGEVARSPVFLTPHPTATIKASTVFDAVRELTDPPMTEAEFDTLADELQGK